MWYGLTKTEALARCSELGIHVRFSVTADPKTWKAAADPLSFPEDLTELADLAGVLKVVRVKEQDGMMYMLLSSFADGTVTGE